MGHPPSLVETSVRRDRDTVWRPRVFDLADPDDGAAVRQLLDGAQVFTIHDTIREQLRDLLVARSPRRTIPANEWGEAVRAELGHRPDSYGRWVWYPWSGTLVHVLPELAFRELRSDRNRYKITATEQAALRTKRIGVVGLSVGQAAVVTMAAEGVGGAFRLADFDALGLSNLNRLRASVADLGVNKAVLAARALYEIDPYLDVDIYTEGVNDTNVVSFFDRGRPLDLLVEECDDFAVKVRLREEARRRRIPVVMDTSDRGLFDVERFDREPDRPLFHGLAGDVRSAAIPSYTASERLLLGLNIVQAPHLSARMRASLVEIRETLTAWPQLASAVALGGAVTADAARRILLGEFTESGRFYVDPEAIVRDGAAQPLPQPLAPVQPSLAEPSVVRPPREAGRVTRDELRYLVAHASAAPSPGNNQPWRFVWNGDCLEAWVEPTRVRASLDFDRRASLVAMGAALENLSLAAGHLGLRADITVLPQADLVAVVRLIRDLATPTDALFATIFQRCTNRKHGTRAPLPDPVRRTLEMAALDGGGTLTLLTAPEELAAFGDLAARSDRLRFLTEPLYRDMTAEVRWTRAEAVATRDGLDLATLELSPLDLVAVRCVTDWPPLEQLRQVGGGTALGGMSARAAATASAVGLVSVTGRAPADYVRGGRATQRVWLAATAAGWALHPMATAHLYAHPEDGASVAPELPRELTAMTVAHAALFGDFHDRANALTFRLSAADPPSHRSLRRSLDDILTFAD